MEFPMMVDNNPFKHNEGWATMAEFYLAPMIDSSVPVEYDMSDINTNSGIETDVTCHYFNPAARWCSQVYG